MHQGSVEFRSRVFGVACHICAEDIEHRGQELLSLAKAELSRLEMKFGAFNSNSLIGIANKLSGQPEFIPLDGEACGLFEFASALWKRSHHLFDPSASVLQSCHSNSETYSIAPLVLADHLNRIGWSKVELRPTGVRITQKGTLIDLDSCVRPYAIDRIRRLFSERDVNSALISLGDDIATIGKQPNGANWLIGVKSPRNTGAAIIRLKLNNRCYSLRGNFQNRISINGENFGRALSPVDGQPIPGLLSIGVMADTCLAAFGAAAVAQVKTEQASLKWLKSLGLPWMAIDRKLQCHGLLSPKK